MIRNTFQILASKNPSNTESMFAQTCQSSRCIRRIVDLVTASCKEKYFSQVRKRSDLASNDNNLASEQRRFHIEQLQLLHMGGIKVKNTKTRVNPGVSIPPKENPLVKSRHAQDAGPTTVTMYDSRDGEFTQVPKVFSSQDSSSWDESKYLEQEMKNWKEGLKKDKKQTQASNVVDSELSRQKHNHRSEPHCVNKERQKTFNHNWYKKPEVKPKQTARRNSTPALNNPTRTIGRAKLQLKLTEEVYRPIRLSDNVQRNALNRSESGKSVTGQTLYTKLASKDLRDGRSYSIGNSDERRGSGTGFSIKKWADNMKKYLSPSRTGPMSKPKESQTKQKVSKSTEKLSKGKDNFSNYNVKEDAVSFVRPKMSKQTTTMSTVDTPRGKNAAIEKPITQRKDHGALEQRKSTRIISKGGESQGVASLQKARQMTPRSEHRRSDWRNLDEISEEDLKKANRPTISYPQTRSTQVSSIGKHKQDMVSQSPESITDASQTPYGVKTAPNQFAMPTKKMDLDRVIKPHNEKEKSSGELLSSEVPESGRNILVEEEAKPKETDEDNWYTRWLQRKESERKQRYTKFDREVIEVGKGEENMVASSAVPRSSRTPEQLAARKLVNSDSESFLRTKPDSPEKKPNCNSDIAGTAPNQYHRNARALANVSENQNDNTRLQSEETRNELPKKSSQTANTQNYETKLETERSFTPYPNSTQTQVLSAQRQEEPRNAESPTSDQPVSKPLTSDTSLPDFSSQLLWMRSLGPTELPRVLRMPRFRSPGFLKTSEDQTWSRNLVQDQELKHVEASNEPYESKNKRTNNLTREATTPTRELPVGIEVRKHKLRAQERMQSTQTMENRAKSDSPNSASNAQPISPASERSRAPVDMSIASGTLQAKIRELKMNNPEYQRHSEHDSKERQTYMEYVRKRSIEMNDQHKTSQAVIEESHPDEIDDPSETCKIATLTRQKLYRPLKFFNSREDKEHVSVQMKPEKPPAVDVTEKLKNRLLSNDECFDGEETKQRRIARMSRVLMAQQMAVISPRQYNEHALSGVTQDKVMSKKILDYINYRMEKLKKDMNELGM